MPLSSISSDAANAAAAHSSVRRVPYTDALRVAGALAVVFLHVSGDGAAVIAKHPTATWWFCLTLEALSRWAVPIFVMVSGLLLLDPAKVETPGQFYKKRLHRIAIPMLAWSVFYLVWTWFYDGTHFSAGAALYKLVSGGAYFHLWFLVMLIGLYLCTPILRIVVRGLTKRQLWITTIVILALAMADAVARANADSDFTFLFKFCPFIGLFFLGYCLRDVPRGKNMVWIGAACWLGGAVIAIASTYLLVYHCATGGWEVDNRLFLLQEEFCPGPLLMSIGVFTMIAAWYESRKIPTASKLIQTLSAASLGIYLIHPCILCLMYTNDIDYTWHTAFVGVPLMVTVGFIGATVATLIIMKIPYVQKTV
jgi:surface polysaccharide O-acyltransferase-like enzyme